MNNDLISRTSLLRNIGRYGVSIDPYNITRLITQKILAEPEVDAKPVRHGRCALCRIKETGHGIIAFYKAGWQACITKRDEGYFMVIGHEGDQVYIPVDFCPNCGADMRGDKVDQGN